MHADPAGVAGTGRYVVWDCETLRLSHEVRGGWRNVKDFGLAVAVTIDDRGVTQVWEEPDARRLIDYLATFPRSVGFNSRSFDLTVLSAYGAVDHLHAAALDLLEEIRRFTGPRRGLSLHNIARAMFGAGKSLADGTEAVRLWRTGRPADRARVIEYCTHDVQLTRRILEFGQTYGYVLVPVPDVRHGEPPLAAQIPVTWGREATLTEGARLVEPEVLDQRAP